MISIVDNDGLKVKFFDVGFPLNQYVNYIYQVKGIPSLGGQRVFPRNNVEIIFNLGNSVKARSIKGISKLEQTDCEIMGNRFTYFDYTPKTDIHFFIIKFNYNGFYKLFGIGQNDFVDTHIGFDILFSNHADFLNEKLQELESSIERFNLLKKWLEGIYRNSLIKGHYIVSYLFKRINENPMVTIKSLEKESGFSRKHLFSCFKNETGLSPKQFQRVTRFQSLLRNVRSKPNWLDLAFEFGFYDQSHLIRDVKHFSGLSPNELVNSNFNTPASTLPIQRSWR